MRWIVNCITVLERNYFGMSMVLLDKINVQFHDFIQYNSSQKNTELKQMFHASVRDIQRVRYVNDPILSLDVMHVWHKNVISYFSASLPSNMYRST